MSIKPNFSQRIGKQSVREQIQIDSIDLELRTALWNYLYSLTLNVPSIHLPSGAPSPRNHFYQALWSEFFHAQLNKFPYKVTHLIEYLRKFFFECPWNVIYDYLESFYEYFEIARIDSAENLEKGINSALIKYLSGYRMISGIITPIVDGVEIKEVETAINNPALNSAIKQHLIDSLSFLSDRQNPNYRNSIKESISAVEALARVISGNPKPVLPDALKAIEKSGKVSFHTALKNGFINIYGWTSDAEGIRHSMDEVSTLQQEDAIFMLVACSSFINYLCIKASNTGIL